MTDVVCSGRARVSLKPLLNDLPLVGAVQVHPLFMLCCAECNVPRDRLMLGGMAAQQK